MTTAPARTIQELRQACPRVTAHRFAVLEWLDSHPHATGDEIGAGDNHHHLVCRACGETADIDCAVAAPPCPTPDEEHGFDIAEAEVVFRGRGRACRASIRRRPPTATGVANDARADGRPAHLTAEV